MSDLLAGRVITLGVTSGIACYKAVDLMRDLQREGARVRVILTKVRIHELGVWNQDERCSRMLNQVQHDV